VPSAWAQRTPRFERERVNGRDAVSREVLVKFRDPIQIQDLLDVAAQTDATSVERIGTTGTLRIRSRSHSAAALVRRLAARLDVQFAEPNHIIQIAATPDDPQYEDLWGLAQIGAAEAWDLSVGANSNVVVGVIDTGIDYTHPDLAPNMWSAPDAFTVTLSSGMVACAAGTHGFNAITRLCDPMDDHDHGTHVSGTIGAAGNNGEGVAGINWQARLMGLKFLDDQGTGTIADAIAAVEFAIAVKQAFQATGGANIRVLSNSWGGSEASQALLDQINAANDSDMLVVAAAGNNGSNNDIFPFFPAAYAAPNLVSVAASTFDDSLTYFSNYGRASVHLAAPGDAILSTTIGHTYSVFSGTSMAAPHVSGAAALVLSLCTLDTAALRETLLGTVDYVPDLDGLTVTGGRLNVNSAMHSCTAPPATPDGLVAAGADSQVTLTWPSVPGALRYNVKRSLTSGGPYDVIAPEIIGHAYTDTGLANGTPYFYVISAENTLGESGDSNEATAVPMIPPDLAIPVFTTPALGGAGVPVAVSITTSNAGPGAAPASVTRIHLSVNSTLEAGDTPLVDIAVPDLTPGAVHAQSLSVPIPADTVAGRYYLIAAADAESALFESQESNNRQSRSIQIGPDLTIAALTVGASGGPGSTIAVTDGTRNGGGGASLASATAFYLSLNTTFSADDVWLGNRTVQPVAPATTDTATTALTIPATTTAGTYYIVAVADVGNAVLETTETNNTYNRQILVGGDAIVSSLTVPSTGAPGSTIVVSDTTKNVGPGPIGVTTTRFYLSTNVSFDSGDVLLAEGRVVPPLASGASDTGSTTLTLPTPLAAAWYYIIAVADGNGDVPETAESNNAMARTIPIGSDLVISSFTAPAFGAPASAIAVTETTTNQGAGAAGGSQTRFYLSTNVTFDSGDTLLPGGREIAALAGGASSTGGSTVTLPAGLTAGTYYLFARADADQTVLEATETNNTIQRMIQIGSDLVVSALTVPAKGGAGQPLTITETTSNTGAAPAGATVTRFYLSVNASLDSSDTMIGSRTVPALASSASSAVTTTLTIPAATASGTYSLIAKSDADGAIPETSETNNVMMRTVSIGSDLLINVPSGVLKVAAGLSIDFTDTVTNQGGGTSSPTTTRYYLSTNTTLSADDVPLTGGRDVPGLTAGSVSAGSTAVSIPASAAAGVAYIIAKADGDNLVSETSETNNTASRSVSIGPDLIVASASSPSSGAAGSTILVTDTITNQGAGAAASTSTRFYLSTNPFLDGADVALSSVRAVAAIDAGASSAGSTAVTIPAGTTPAFYYLLVKADGDSTVAESFENNNVMARSLWVTAAP
jgi:subtilisin family serine protease/subtilase family serine protease